MIANPPEEEEEEEILQTRIISPKEVARNWPDWLEAVEAEVVSLPEEKEALRRLTKEEHEEIKGKAESQGRKVEYIPSKVVFTVKPIPGGTKKKVRWVACGNFEPRKEGEEHFRRSRFSGLPNFGLGSGQVQVEGMRHGREDGVSQRHDGTSSG